MKKIPISERYKFRAKWEDTFKNVEWVYGALSWREIMPSPIKSKEEPDKDINLYKILARQKNVTPDWNLPYSYTTYWIQEEYYDTITPYSGWKDMKGTDIYFEDIVRIFSGVEYWDCWITEYGILLSCANEFKNIVDYCSCDSNSRILTNCLVVGNKWDGPVEGVQLQDWIVHNKNWKDEA